MKLQIVGTLLSLLLIGCNTQMTESTNNENKNYLTDSIRFNEAETWLKFNDYGLFDTTFIFEQYFGFCSFGADLSLNFFQPRFSNKKFNNNDSTGFGYEPKDDSILFLSFYWQVIDGTKDSYEVQSMSKLESENLSRISTKRLPYTQSFFYEFNLWGFQAGIFGAESAFKNRTASFSKLELYTIIGAIKITAYFQYSGEGSHSYLNDFIEIAKTMRVEKWQTN